MSIDFYPQGIIVAYDLLYVCQFDFGVLLGFVASNKEDLLFTNKNNNGEKYQANGVQVSHI